MSIVVIGKIHLPKTISEKCQKHYFQDLCEWKAQHRPKPLTIFAKRSILDLWQVSEYASVISTGVIILKEATLIGSIF